ncbi:synaptotagmin-like protein 3 isoform X2 [Sinocyclocheilus anshuiensis]|uniref:Synaptotagmin-like protein 3 n=1 Tax=Sinocyclocheilus anshuiensis TaxID=1608454 RepID=A0A671QF81_9TELE|nr:PREDICTED: synaptotagmin-like protein 3 isoform X2 [Sinocyclocheilus anshuiensis]
MKLEQKNWEIIYNHVCTMDLGLFQALERERVLEVLQRDKALRTIEADRIRRLKVELQGICRQGAKAITRPYGQRSCARCQRLLGKFWDCGSVCCGCSHRICKHCRVVWSAQEWKCTMCHAYREFKIKSGEWFLEQQAKKFPDVRENSHETIGDKLLQSYQRLSFIAVVPPTPPPVYEASSYNRLIHLTEQDLKKSKPFTKSVENLMVSVSAHIKKFSKSQNDLSVEAGQLTVDHGLLQNSRHKSRSESAINKANLCKAPSLPNLSHNSRGTEQYASTSTLYLTDDDASYTSAYSNEQRDSNSSTGMDCGISENTSVTGEVEVAFGYNNRTSCLEITVKACKNLMFGDMKKKCHPYVKVCLLPKKYHDYKMKTVVKMGNNPVYNETFTCVVAAEQLGSSVVQVSVWHCRGLKRKLFLGETLVRLADLCLESTDTQRSVCYALGPKGYPLGGDVELLLKAQFQFLPQTCPHTADLLIGAAGQLKVVITDVSKLRFLSKTAYIEGILCLPGARELVQRSPALKKTAGSVQMNFSRLTRQELQQATLQLNLWEKNTFILTDRLLRSARLAGESSWQRLQQMPGEWHDFLLPFHANVSTSMRS